ncbi:MAG: helix-turn-helix domain-containing protein [Duodenibacillus sp.]
MPSLTALQRNIRRLMVEEGITYRGLAKAAGLDQSSIGRILSGTSMPRYATIAKIAQVLRTTPALLMFDETDHKEIWSGVRETQSANAPETETKAEAEAEAEAETAKADEVHRARVSKNVEGCMIRKIALHDALLEPHDAPSDTDVLAPDGVPVAENAFCASADNSSMLPTIRENDLIFFVRVSDADVRSDDIVAAKTSYGIQLGRLVKGACGINWLTFDNTSAPGSQPVQIESVVAKAVSFYRQL